MDNAQIKIDLANALAEIVATIHRRPYADVYADALEAVKAARAKVASAGKPRSERTQPTALTNAMRRRYAPDVQWRDGRRGGILEPTRVEEQIRVAEQMGESA